jgi:hypothetical protein
MCEKGRVFPKLRTTVLCRYEIGVPRNGLSIHLLNGVQHSNHIAAQEFGVRRVIGYPPHKALLSGNPLSRMLSQDTLDVCLELSFHFGFSVLKTASVYRER